MSKQNTIPEDRRERFVEVATMIEQFGQMHLARQMGLLPPDAMVE